MFFNTPTLLAALATLSTLLTTSAVPLEKRSYSGRATYYAVGLGACGSTNVASDYIVALNSAQFGSGYPGPECGKQITIWYGSNSATATIMDECPSCPYGGLDLSQGLFEHFASTDVGVFQMTWDYAGAVTPATSTTPTTTWQAPTTTSTSAYTPPTSTYTPPTTTSQTPATTSTNSPTTAAVNAATTSNTSSSATALTNASTSSNPFFASAAPSATVSSSSSTPGGVQTMSNIETLSQVLANLGQLVVLGSS